MAAELIALKVIAADIGSLYIQSFKRENIFVIDLPAIAKWEGLKIIIIKELYGL